MNNVRKRFILYALLSVFVLLTVLLSVISGVNFTMAAQDADEITLRLSDGGGSFGPMNPRNSAPRDGGTFGGPRIGPMGPASPELSATLRHFTCVFDRNGNSRMAAFAMSAVTEEEALEWAAGLLNRSAQGWTGFTYRYRVRDLGDLTYVTVIDQGRELLPCYRILIISVVGEVLSLLCVWAVLSVVSRRLFRPLENAERKQRLFLSEAERNFKTPLTVIYADTELLEREHGHSESTNSIRRQAGRLTELVRELSVLSAFRREELRMGTVNLSEVCTEVLDGCAPRFTGEGKNLTAEVAPDITLAGDETALRQCVAELMENALKYCASGAFFRLAREGERVELTVSNDTGLPAANVDQVFDRFTRLENAATVSGAGLGLAYVKDAVLAHSGRVSAKCAGGTFTVSLRL